MRNARIPALRSGKLIALVVLTEAAGAAGSRCEVDEVLRDLLGANPVRFATQDVDEVAGREAGGTALADVGDLAAGEQVFARRRRHDLGPVAEILHGTLHHALCAPVQISEENGDAVPLCPGKGLRLVSAIRLRGAAGRGRDASRFRGGGVSSDHDRNIGERARVRSGRRFRWHRYSSVNSGRLFRRVASRGVR